MADLYTLNLIFAHIPCKKTCPVPHTHGSLHKHASCFLPPTFPLLVAPMVPLSYFAPIVLMPHSALLPCFAPLPHSALLTRFALIASVPRIAPLASTFVFLPHAPELVPSAPFPLVAPSQSEYHKPYKNRLSSSIPAPHLVHVLTFT